MQVETEGNVLIKGTPGGRIRGDRGATGQDPKSDLAKQICKRQGRLESDREYQDSLWDDIDMYATARRAKYDIGTKTGSSADQPAGQMIYDGSTNAAIRDFCDGWQSQTANAVVDWWAARFRHPDLKNDYQGKKWLDQVKEVLVVEMANSNFYEQLNIAYQDGTSHAIATMVGPEFDVKSNRFFCLERHPREIFIATDWRGEVDLWHRKFLITGRQLLDQFGEDVLPPKLQRELTGTDRNLYRQYTCIEAIYRREERDIMSPLRIDKPWAHIFVLEEEKVVLDEGGYDDIDLPDTWRWYSDATYPYGSCPAIDTLRDIMGGNSAMKSLLYSWQLAVRPAIVATQQMKGHIRLTPDGKTYLRTPNDKVEAFQYPAQFQVGNEAISDFRQEIGERFKSKVFQLQAQMGGKITAFQANLIQGEKAAALIPITTRASAQLLVPKVNKFFYAAVKAGRIPAPPPSVLMHANAPVDISIVGPMAVAAKRYLSNQGVNAFFAFLAEVTKVAPNVVQAMTQAINPDELRKYITDGDGTPSKIFLDDKQLAEIRQAAQKLQEQQQKQQAMGQLMDSYQKGTQAPEAGSPAEAMAKQ